MKSLLTELTLKHDFELLTFIKIVHDFNTCTFAFLILKKKLILYQSQDPDFKKIFPFIGR